MAGEEASVAGTAGRYATALLELSLEQDAVDAVRTDLDRFDRLIEEQPDLRRLVRSPVFTSEEQGRAMAALTDKLEIGGLTRNFLLLVARNRRLFALPEIIAAFRTLVARHYGEVTAEVTVAEPLSQKHLDSLKEALVSVTGKPGVGVRVTVDPAIIGGLVVKLGSRMIDTSLRTKLNAMKIAMKEAR